MTPARHHSKSAKETMSIRSRHGSSHAPTQPLTIKTNLNVSDIHPRSTINNPGWSPVSKHSQSHSFSQSRSLSQDLGSRLAPARHVSHPYHSTQHDPSSKIIRKPTSRGSVSGQGQRDRSLRPLFTSTRLVKPSHDLHPHPYSPLTHSHPRASLSPSPTGHRPRPSRITVPTNPTSFTTVIPIPINQAPQGNFTTSPIQPKIQSPIHQSSLIKRTRIVPERSRVPARSRFPAPGIGKMMAEAEQVCMAVGSDGLRVNDRVGGEMDAVRGGGVTGWTERDDGLGSGDRSRTASKPSVDLEKGSNGEDKSHEGNGRDTDEHPDNHSRESSSPPSWRADSDLPPVDAKRIGAVRNLPLSSRDSSLHQHPSTRSSSRVIRASREGTPVVIAPQDDMAGSKMARKIYAVVRNRAKGGKEDFFRGDDVVESATAPPRSPPANNHADEQPEDNDVEEEGNDDEPVCWTCHTKKSVGRNVNPRGYDEPTQEYRQLSKGLQKALPGLAPCRKCLPDEPKRVERASQRKARAEPPAPGSKGPSKSSGQSLCLNDVEAALILSYIERDERLLSEYQAGDHKGKYMFLADKEDFSQLMVERSLAEKGLFEAERMPLSAKAVANGGVGALGMSVKRKDGVVRQLSKGVCGNCGTDETGAIMWRTDQVVKEQFGLKRKLCNKCGLYKQTNLVDRPILHAWSTSQNTPTNSTRTSTPAGIAAAPAFAVDIAPVPPDETKREKRPRMDTVMEGRLRRDSLASVASRSSASHSNDSCKPRQIRRDKGVKRARMHNGGERFRDGVMGKAVKSPDMPAQLRFQASLQGNSPVQGMPLGFILIPNETPISGSHGHLGYQWNSPGQMTVGAFHLTSGGYQVDQIPSPPLSPT